MYKIFINDKPLLLSQSRELPERFKDLNHYTESSHQKIMDLVREVEGLQHKGAVLFSETPQTWFQEFRTHFIEVEAGGGIVFNQKNEILLIKRLGKWDLPKGKIDPGESREHAALREVEEECGLKELKITSAFDQSYHTYKLQGHRFLKITYWYEMQTSFEGRLIPQEEENITEVAWFNWSELDPETLDTYQSIRELLMELKERTHNS